MEILDSKRCNNLTGKEWLQNSFSIWRGVSKTKEEMELKHPASYPIELCEKLIRTFSKEKANILDPFNGIGSTMLATENLNRFGVGIDLSEHFCEIATSRLKTKNIEIINGDSFSVIPKLVNDSFDLCLTSPPYWDILNMKRSADLKENKNYSDKDDDLGNISDYNSFIDMLGDLFLLVFPKLKTRAYCIINVMDIRKKNVFYPLHMDVSIKMQSIGYKFDDIIIWDRQNDYNNMRPLGYPYRFRVNKVHEYLLIFTKE